MPCPKDPVKLAEYKALQSKIAKERGYGKWMKGKIIPQAVIDKGARTRKLLFNTPEMKQKLSDTAKRSGCGKWMKGRKNTPFLNTSHKVYEFRRGKTFEEIYGEKAEEWRSKVRASNLKRFEGITRKEQRPYQGQGYEYSEWRRLVFKRDDFTCQVCFKRGGDLEAHHIKSWAKFPELRYVVSNGKTTCKDPCHKILNKEQRQDEKIIA